MKTSKSVPGSACHANSHRRWRRAHGPRRGRGDARLARRLSHPVRQPGQTLTSSIAPALITCLRWRGFTSECAREGAARHNLLRRHRGSSSTCPAPTIPPVCGLLDHQAVQLQWPTRRRRRQLWILPDRTRRCSRTVLAALVVHLMPALNATRRAALPPSDVPPHAGSPFASCHKAPPAPQPHNATPPAAANVASPV